MVTDADRQVRRIRREPDPAAEIVLAVRFRRGSHNRLGVQLRLVRLNMTMEGIMDSSINLEISILTSQYAEI